MLYTINTYSGKQFDPYFAEKSDICIEDIAHALSLMTRANGHFSDFYSVAQHSVACCLEAKARNTSPKTALFCLLHDSAEAYMSDVTRPVKARMPEFKAAEEKLLSLIFDVLAGSQPDDAQKKIVKQIDDAMLHAEFHHFMNIDFDDNTEKLVHTPDFSTVPFKTAENEFLALYKELSAKTAE